MIKNEEVLKRLLNQPETFERNGRIQAVLDLHLNTDQRTTGEIRKDHREDEKIYWEAYIDTYNGLCNKESRSRHKYYWEI